MSAFLTTLDARIIKHLPNGRPLWRLLSPLVYDSELLGFITTVPTGHETDLASVPRLPLIYLLAGDTAHEASVVHDYLYSTGDVQRATADAVFREAMAVVGEPAWRRWAMWAAVRAFGGGHYGADYTV